MRWVLHASWKILLVFTLFPRLDAITTLCPGSFHHLRKKPWKKQVLPYPYLSPSPSSEYGFACGCGFWCRRTHAAYGPFCLISITYWYALIVHAYCSVYEDLLFYPCVKVSDGVWVHICLILSRVEHVWRPEDINRGQFLLSTWDSFLFCVPGKLLSLGDTEIAGARCLVFLQVWRVWTQLLTLAQQVLSPWAFSSAFIFMG